MSASWPCRRWLTRFAWLLLVAVAAISPADAAELTASWIDNSSGEAAFEIERRAENEFDFSKIADVPAGSQSYVDSNVSEFVVYCYRIRARGLLAVWSIRMVCPFSVSAEPLMMVFPPRVAVLPV